MNEYSPFLTFSMVLAGNKLKIVGVYKLGLQVFLHLKRETTGEKINFRGQGDGSASKMLAGQT